MTKNDAYITMDSFGSDLPNNWEAAADLMNSLIDELPVDEFGEIDRDAVDAIWNRYCSGEFDSVLEANA